MNKAFTGNGQQAVQVPTRTAGDAGRPRAAAVPVRSGPEDGDKSETSRTLPAIPQLDDKTAEVAESEGYDPYNSGSFDSTKYKSDD